MAEILPRHFVYGILVFTFIIVGGTVMMSEFNSVNPDFMDTDKFTEFNNTFNTLEDVTTSVTGLETGIEGTDVDAGTYGVLGGLINSAWNTLKLMFTSFAFMTTAILGLDTFLPGMPSFIPAIIVLFITVLLAFSIFSAIFQREL